MVCYQVCLQSPDLGVEIMNCLTWPVLAHTKLQVLDAVVVSDPVLVMNSLRAE